ncbi:heme transporter hrg1-A-like [Leucoraja erinacea]|uniref:heme transporter hrg1-A-like n=1 Tax=Leucoraja erinaceus TaxID=7782 RepID=UPI002456615C|nr:heme transporter hrg1-A-like [Leucoraja erinacea]
MDLRRQWLKLAYATLGVAFGLSAFLCWTLAFNQPATAAFGGLSGVLALWTLVTHLMYGQDLWRTWLQGLRCFRAVGVVFSLVAVAGAVTFISLAITQRQSFIDPRSYYLTSIWCFITLKWSLFLSFYSHRYCKEFDDIGILIDF